MKTPLIAEHQFPVEESDPLAHLRELAEKFERAVELIDHRDRHPGSMSELPSSVTVRRIIKMRRMRDTFFDANMFADPVWDILLDLMAARLDQQQVSISSACIAAAVPISTAMRILKAMLERNLIDRFQDPSDGRRSFVRLTDDTARKMEAYLAAYHG